MSTSESEDSSSVLRKTGSSLGSSDFWLITIMMNLLYWPNVYPMLSEPGKIDSAESLFIYAVLVMFGLLAAGLLFKGLLHLLHYWKYGSSTLQLETNPGVLGGPLKGELIVPEQLHRDANAMQFDLTCVQITEHVDPDGDRDQKRTPIWDGVKTVPASEWTGSSNPSEKAVPFTMTIPYDCRETDHSGSDEITWELTAQANVPGIDFSITFTVPVKETERSEPALTEEEIVDLKSVDRPEGVEDLSFREIGDGFEFVRPMFYAPLYYLTWFLVGSVFVGVGIAGFQFIEELPIPALFVTGPATLFTLIGFVTVVFSVQSLIQSQHVTVRPDEIRLHTSWFGYQREYIISSQNVEGIKIEQSGHSGENPNYHLTISKSDGNDVETAYLSSDKRVIEYLMQEMQDTMGI